MKNKIQKSTKKLAVVLLMAAVFLIVMGTTAYATCVVNPAPVSFWPADVDASDFVGTDNGILIGVATAGSPGIVNGAFSFDGAGDHINVLDSSTTKFGTADFSISTWIKSTGTGTQYIYNKGLLGGTHPQYWLRIEAAGNIRAITSTPLGGSSLVNSDAGTPGYNYHDNLWHNVVFVRQSQINYLYVDGVLLQSTGGAGQNTDITADFKIGADNNGGNSFNGQIDEVAVFNRALSSSEVSTLFNSGSPASVCTLNNCNWGFPDGACTSPETSATCSDCSCGDGFCDSSENSSPPPHPGSC